MDSAGLVIKRIVNPYFVSYVPFHDVVGTIYLSLPVCVSDHHRILSQLGSVSTKHPAVRHLRLPYYVNW
jgi:hypothetical protein